MINIYKKINKTRDNRYGIKEITNAKQLNNPFLLCITSDPSDKSIFGIIRDGAHAARFHTTQEYAAKYNLENTPIDFVGVRFSNIETVAEELVNTLFYPHIVAHGFNLQTMFKQARKVNLFLFDEAARIYLNVEKLLYKKLQEINVSEEEIKYILKQIAVISLGSKEDLKNTYATAISFVDTNDGEIETPEFLDYQKLMQDKDIKSMYFYWGDNNTYLYPFLGTGEHTPKYYLSNESPVKAAISAFVSNVLLNALLNCNVVNRIEMSREFNSETLCMYDANRMPMQEALHLLDHNINYQNAPKYTDDEAYFRNEVDSCYKLISEADKIIDTYDAELDNIKNKLNLLVSAIKENCDEETFEKILEEGTILPPKEHKNKTTKKSSKKTTKNNKKAN